MGKGLLYFGLGILLIAVGPVLIIELLALIGIIGKDPNPVVFVYCGSIIFWPGVVITALGILFRFFEYLIDKIPHK